MTALYWTLTGMDIWMLSDIQAYKIKNLITNETMILESVSDLNERKFVPVQMPKTGSLETIKAKKPRRKSVRKNSRKYSRQPKRHVGKSGYKGVSKLGKKWRAQVWEGALKKNITIGLYDHPLLAAAAYQERKGNHKEAKRLRNEYEEGDRMPENQNEIVNKNIHLQETY